MYSDLGGQAHDLMTSVVDVQGPIGSERLRSLVVNVELVIIIVIYHDGRTPGVNNRNDNIMVIYNMYRPMGICFEFGLIGHCIMIK